MSDTIELNPGFFLIKNYFSQKSSVEWTSKILDLCSDSERGFHHPSLKPNRFHNDPKYPVKKFTCLGKYWNPMDYRYYEQLPFNGKSTLAIPQFLINESLLLVEEFFPEFLNTYKVESVMVNFYCKDQSGKPSTMGVHQDKDEKDLQAPIVGFNFGSTAKFVFNEKETLIPSDSAYIFGGKSRLMHHGVKNVLANTVPDHLKDFMKSKERLNLTVRKVGP